MDALARELEEAKARQRRAERGLHAARDRAREADRTARDARRRGRRTAAAVERLPAGDSETAGP
ncbi:hypothetical protein J7E88_29295 [Streptomyces sp. ISL-10]|uniref:hypothetical protein n=1 Tax=Streptomyces sp. ISL-10 TaxID=2819172 RepID=UPI001BE4F683|nr:hypothetical protein [Streptomyces sp. ISL-10]MBT2369296.1 hypothetical protein [Streptomyces sp. ISL-10]